MFQDNNCTIGIVVFSTILLIMDKGRLTTFLSWGFIPLRLSQVPKDLWFEASHNLLSLLSGLDSSLHH